ncbi:MAG: ATP-binding protein [Oligoflexia bacterium]|nr:ATP-binding protein [Oligoflexia bacterium]MBF0367544.1 ATP-binding protein [Oligoflexia bacterium]
MKEIVVISGKGGTGKTSFTASLAMIGQEKIMVDADVDAADLHLVCSPEKKESFPFIGGKKATIDSDKCINCGQCQTACRFEAIAQGESTRGKFIINKVKCEGCGVCKLLCPHDAITTQDNQCGEWYISNTRFGTLVHAKLGIAQDNSGKLVSTIRTAAKKIAQEKNVDYIFIDGPPGIGCPVISSITGASSVVVVTEATLSGFHDFKRIVELTKYFKIQTSVCINKSDINDELSNDIEIYALKRNILVLGRIPYSKYFNQAQNHGLNIIEYAKQVNHPEVNQLAQRVRLMINKVIGN